MSDYEQVVLRYRDGRTERVMLAPIDATREVLIVSRDDEPAEVPFSQLKAVFFPQTDPDGPLDEVGAVVRGPLTQERSKRRVVNDQPLDHDPLPIEPDPGDGIGTRFVAGLGAQDGERRAGDCFHAETLAAACDT